MRWLVLTEHQKYFPVVILEMDCSQSISSTLVLNTVFIHTMPAKMEFQGCQVPAIEDDKYYQQKYI